LIIGRPQINHQDWTLNLQAQQSRLMSINNAVFLASKAITSTVGGLSPCTLEVATENRFPMNHP
jgi:hypothetical protein